MSRGNDNSELTRKWEHLVESDPSRVIGIFDNGLYEPLIRNHWGDTRRDIRPASVALEKKINAVSSSSFLRGLLEAGLVQKLCDCISGRCITLERREVFYSESNNEPVMHSPYLVPMRMLFLIARFLQSPPSAADLLVLDTLRTQWPSMMQRIWADPSTTGYPDDQMSPERYMVQMTAQNVVKSDPDFFQILHEDEDLTLRIITRHWVHSTNATDNSVLYIYIRSLFFWQSTRYDDTNISLAKRVLQDVWKGCGKSYRIFLTKIVWSIERFSMDEAKEYIFLLSLLYNLSATLRTSAASSEPNFARTLFKTTAVWECLFLLLSRTARDSRAAHTAESKQLYRSVIDLFALCAVQTWMEPADAANFLKLVVQAGMFNTFDEVLPLLVSESDLSQSISFALLHIVLLTRIRPSILRFLRQELPRPISVRAILDSSFTGVGKPRPPRYLPTLEQLVSIEDASTDQLAHIRSWSLWDMLEVCCQVHGECMRRGCTRRRRYFCKACRRTEYCGSDCQRRDWQEHRLVCGFAVITHDPPGVSNLTGNPLELKLPYRFQA